MTRRNIFIFLYLSLYAVIFFSWLYNINFSFIEASPRDTIYVFLRLVGLTAFFLIFVQVITGSFRAYFSTIFGPNFIKFHITSGIFVLLLILTHPTLFRISQYFDNSFVLKNVFFPHFEDRFSTLTSIGQIGFYLILLTISAALLRKNKYISKYWFKVHLLNFSVFFILFYHSYNIGTDTALFPLNILWPIMALIILFVVICKVGNYIKIKLK